MTAPMTGLQTLLEGAVDHPIGIDVDGDLRRGHRALSRRRTRWAATGIAGGLVVAGAAGYAAWPRQDAVAVKPATGPASTAPIRTVYYDAPPPPVGWHLEGAEPAFLSVIPDGTPSTNIWRFDGKIVVMFHEASGGSFGFGSTTRVPRPHVLRQRAERRLLDPRRAAGGRTMAAGAVPEGRRPRPWADDRSSSTGSASDRVRRGPATERLVRPLRLDSPGRRGRTKGRRWDCWSRSPRLPTSATSPTPSWTRWPARSATSWSAPAPRAAGISVPTSASSS